MGPEMLVIVVGLIALAAAGAYALGNRGTGTAASGTTSTTTAASTAADLKALVKEIDAGGPASRIELCAAGVQVDVQRKVIIPPTPVTVAATPAAAPAAAPAPVAPAVVVVGGGAAPAAAPVAPAAPAAPALTMAVSTMTGSAPVGGPTSAVYLITVGGAAVGTPVTVSYPGLPAGTTPVLLGGPVPGPVAPGAVLAGQPYLVNIAAVAPAAPGNYHFQFQAAAPGYVPANAPATLTLT